MELFDLSLFNSTLRMVTPILLAALGGMLCARVGIFNVGLEGLILIGAFTAVAANYFTGSLFLSVVIASIASVILSLLFAWITIHLKANEIVVGIGINFLALGLTTFLLRALFDVKGAFYDKDMLGLTKLDIPLLKELPIIGSIISGHSVLVYGAIISAFILFIFFSRTVLGFHMTAIGMNSIASSSIGLKVKKLQYAAIGVCGVLCGLAGAQLSLGQVTMFTEGMTAGRGFISLVAMMLGQSHPLGILVASFLFGLMDAISIRLQSFSIPTQFTSMLPFILTLGAMFLVNRKKTTNLVD